MKAKKQVLFYIMTGVMVLSVARSNTSAKRNPDESKKVKNLVAEDMPMSMRMAESTILRAPHLALMDFEHPKWAYVPGLIGKAMIELSKATGEKKYYEYARAYVDTIIDNEGVIHGKYKMDEFNIDNINSGKILFDLYQDTNNEKYKKAIFTLRRQLEWMPRTKDGGFWHKRIYPWQMWLDGIYMASPFYARFIEEFGNEANYDDVAKQIILIDEKTYDPDAALHYHGWDESRIQRWSDPETGLSPNFWSRAVGWYAMALVDVLDYFPQNHPDRNKILEILGRTVDGVINCQDEETGLWCQVLDQAGREGNYLEASGSSMFVYTIAKAVKKGYIDKSYFKYAKKGYSGILEHLIRVEGNGMVNLAQCSTSAGLGGNPYRDGSYEYYISEEIAENDGKSVGPFILASLLMEEMDN